MNKLNTLFKVCRRKNNGKLRKQQGKNQCFYIFEKVKPKWFHTNSINYKKKCFFVNFKMFWFDSWINSYNTIINSPSETNRCSFSLAAGRSRLIYKCFHWHYLHSRQCVDWDRDLLLFVRQAFVLWRLRSGPTWKNSRVSNFHRHFYPDRSCW